MIFVDTSAWFARIVPSDPHHEAAVRWTQANSERLVTTDYVADETLTLLKVRAQTEAALALGRALFGGEVASMNFLTEEEIRQAWRVFVQYQDKGWSFTDVTSKVIVEALDIRQAFAFDRHFRQFGSLEVVPLR